MDDSIRKQIIGIRSKYCEPILEFLAKEGELYHGDLAEKLQVSPSGLNVIIKKMQESNPPIIDVMQIGKYKIYTLPTAVREYMENKKNANSSDEQENTESEDIILCLQHFVEVAGKEWKDRLNLLLRGEESGVNNDVVVQFDKLMKSVVNAAKYNEEAFGEMKRFLNNEILECLLQDYLEELAECEKIMKQIGQRENGKKLVRHFKIQ